MDVERTIEFLVKNQARMDARFDAKFDRADKRFAEAEKRFAEAEKRFAQSEKRLDRLERGLAQNNRIVTQLARSGVTLRSDVRKTEKHLAEIAESLSEMDGKLNALIDFVDRQARGNGGRR
jgi:septal ring factor EnvC (AmiA/AmiB activator)